MERRRISAVMVAGFAALTLTACGTAGAARPADGTPTTSSLSTAAVADTPTPTLSPTPMSASPSASPSTSPSAVPPASSATAVRTKAPATRPAPTHRRTTAPPVHHTTAPAVHHTTAPAVHHTTAPAASGVCSIRSNAGNCYRAGQFCRKADLGATTTDASGRSITCVMESGKPHWH
ncbi:MULTISPECIES: hypothetical protein [unclassified Streptomyces]|uniref:hypothetical protein n=1 Tax=unclassified Streptomyces TaxID=2593676 RepID=UPI00114CE440|nr:MULTISPECIES: hypothetical protein [unclassified Streptomyces]MYS22302.1 hypothetical protein [Streptomyces sp. SID4948]